MSGLPVWVKKWWDVANDRRGRLIVRKYKSKKGLTKAHEEELEMLQKVAAAILNYASPPRDFKMLDELEKKIEQLKEKK